MSNGNLAMTLVSVGGGSQHEGRIPKALGILTHVLSGSLSSQKCLKIQSGPQLPDAPRTNTGWRFGELHDGLLARNRRRGDVALRPRLLDKDQ